MKKPSRTAGELEASIKVDSLESRHCFTDFIRSRARACCPVGKPIKAPGPCAG